MKIGESVDQNRLRTELLIKSITQIVSRISRDNKNLKESWNTVILKRESSLERIRRYYIFSSLSEKDSNRAGSGSLADTTFTTDINPLEVLIFD